METGKTLQAIMLAVQSHDLRLMARAANSPGLDRAADTYRAAATGLLAEIVAASARLEIGTNAASPRLTRGREDSEAGE